MLEKAERATTLFSKTDWSLGSSSKQEGILEQNANA